MSRQDRPDTAILLFVFNRPSHAKTILENLRSHQSLFDSPILIFSDGPRKQVSEDQDLVSRVRKVCYECASNSGVEIIERDSNLGLARNIVEGVQHAFTKHDRVIVLEDDLILSEDFFPFMYEMLDRFADSPNVFQISGYMCPASIQLPGVGLFRVPGSWGWATWRRAWENYSHDVGHLISSIGENRIDEFNVEGTYDHFATLLENRDGMRDTWAVRWYASAFLSGGFTVYPSSTLVENAGYDGSGTNCGVGNQISSIAGVHQEASWRNAPCGDAEESREFLEAFQSFYRALQDSWVPKPSFWEKLRHRLFNSLRRRT